MHDNSRDTQLAQRHDATTESAEAGHLPDQPPAPANENEIRDLQDGSLQDAPPQDDPAPVTEFGAAPRSGRARSKTPSPFLRGLLKPLVSVATSQYTLVLLLVVLSAITVARTTSTVINDKFLAITQALKRY